MDNKLDPSKLLEQNPISAFEQYVLPWLDNIAFAILIFVVGRWVAKMIVKLVRKIMYKANVDSLLIDFVGSILGGLLTLVVVIASLDQLGVDTTSLIALIGAAGLAVGLALQGTLANFASGVLLIIFKPFKVGDFIEAGGVSGVIEQIRIFSTVFRSPDNKELMVPNGKIFEDTIVNYSARGTRRIDMVIGIGYDADIKLAKDTLWELINADDRILKDPAATVAVNELADSSVNFIVRPWVKTSDYWAVHGDFMEKVKITFDEKSISIPFPQLDLHVVEGLNASS